MPRVYPLLLLSCALMATGCSRDEPAAPAQAPRTQTARAPIGTLPLGDGAAFDLVATGQGAALIWAAPGPCAGSLRMLSLDAGGQPLGEHRPMVDGCAAATAVRGSGAQITELAAAAAAGKLGLAWVLERGGTAEVLATYGDDSARALAPPTSLAATVASAEAPDGRLAMTASDTGQLLIAYRTTPGPCEGGAGGRCAHYVARPHPDPSPGRGRGVEQREVPEPCRRMLPGGQWLAGTWFDAVCARQPRPTTTVFVIRPEISYAAAVEALPGCGPWSLSPAGARAILLGECPEGLSAHVLTPDGQGGRELRGIEREAGCRRGRPLLRLRQPEKLAEEVELRSPSSRLGPLLPPSLGGEGARAAFTGQVLVVAAPVRGGIEVRSYACTRDGRIERVDR
ncbi:MAG: hypothetical protein PVI30_12070 [Myxococcales bacterium]|jgi:hypothetical protein